MQKVAPRRFIVQLILFVSCFAVINVMVSLVTHNTISRKLLRGYKQAQDNGGIDVLFVGHSLIAAGINDKAFLEASNGKRSYNLGVGWSGLIEHIVLLKHATKDAEKRGRKYDIVVYGLSNMIGNRPPHEGSHGANSAFLYYLDPSLAAKYVAHTPLEQAEFWTTAALPYLQEKTWVWAQVEKLRRVIAGMGIPRQASNKFGAVDDFEKMESPGRDALVAEIKEVLQRPESDFFHPIMKEIIAEGKQHARRVVLVTMPKTQRHRDHFYTTPEWADFQHELTRVVEKSGAEHIDARDWIPDTDEKGNANFDDSVHLSANGAKLFSAMIARRLYETPQTISHP
jgi:hypothetical protein